MSSPPVARSHDGEAGAGRKPGPPDVERLARAVAHAFLEVEAGRRPLSQLRPVLSPAVWQRLRPLLRPGGTCPGADAVVSVHTAQPRADVCDAAVVVRRGSRVGALTIRLERHEKAWRVVELARPEDN